MNYEQEYKAALERAEILKKTCGSTAVIGWCEHIFPELKESEDEKIRKVLVRWFEVGARGSETFNGISTDKILAWLEKQKETYNPYKESILAIYSMFDKVDEYKKQKKMHNFLATIRSKCVDAIMYEENNK